MTGGAQGIGASVASRFFQEGASIVLLDKSEKVREYATILDPSEKRVLPLITDIRLEMEVQRALQTARDRFNKLDVLINNAGVCTLNRCLDLTESEWDLVLGVNLKGLWLCTKHFLRLVRKNSGAIVNVASQAAKRAQNFICSL